MAIFHWSPPFPKAHHFGALQLLVDSGMYPSWKSNTPRYRTPVRQSPYPTMKGFPQKQPVGKGGTRGVFQFGVLKQPEVLGNKIFMHVFVAQKMGRILGSSCHFSSLELLGGGFKYFLFSPLFGEDSHFD